MIFVSAIAGNYGSAKGGCIVAYRARRIVVPSSDFRQIAIRRQGDKPERLFRAVICAFCSLTRPSRRERAQLDDLTLPLFDTVSSEALRFAAAALSECEYVPMGLVRRLCAAPVEIAAPLLVRSPVLGDVDLIILIGRHGLPHARAIARRKNLNPAIANLIKALERPTLVRTAALPNAENSPSNAKTSELEAIAKHVAGQAAEQVRHRLRSLMSGQSEAPAAVNPASAPTLYARLRKAALGADAATFQAALADALEIDISAASHLIDSSSYLQLLTALRALDMGEDKAFLIAVAIFPKLFPHPEAVRLFLDRYRRLDREIAEARVHNWQSSAARQAPAMVERETANSDTPAPAKATARQLTA